MVMIGLVDGYQSMEQLEDNEVARRSGKRSLG